MSGIVTLMPNMRGSIVFSDIKGPVFIIKGGIHTQVDLKNRLFTTPLLACHGVSCMFHYFSWFLFYVHNSYSLT